MEIEPLQLQLYIILVLEICSLPIMLFLFLLEPSSLVSIEFGQQCNYKSTDFDSDKKQP
ncbi:uncharacterized protein DS421_3g68760 [Arachis hypogaea]|nr:uncharacterized protein DS421_3g68760 [Arachis hypogaea]